MQNNGTLRKRNRRHLAKVKALSSWLPSDEENGSLHLKSSKDVGSITHPSIGLLQLLTRNKSPTAVSSFDQLFKRDPACSVVDEVLGSLSNKENYLESRVEVETESGKNENCKSAHNDRPYFLDPATMSRLKQILVLAICSGTVPWRFNSKTKQIDRWNPSFEKGWRVQWYLVTFQTACLTAYQFYSFISRMQYLQEKSNRELFMASVSVYWYVCAVYFNINMYIYEDKIRQYINTLFRFNREFVEKYVIHLEDYPDGGRLVINLSIPSNTSQVFASVALFLVLPYEPWYLFSYIYPKPWYWLIPGAMHEFILVGQVISNYILYQWIMVAHSNSLEFWLREMHNQNESGYTRDSLRDYHEGIKCYRKLQVLCSCFNECMSPLAIPLLKTHIFTGLVPCGYVVIRSLNEKFIEEFPGILTYPICVIDCATAGFTTLSLAAEVFDLAAGFLDSWSRTRKKEFRRVLMSCPALRVWVGRCYFITVATTITFFKVITDFIINAIIAFP